MAKQEVVYWIRPEGTGDVGYGQVTTRRAGDYFYVEYDVTGKEFSSMDGDLKEALKTVIKKAGFIPVDLDTL